MPPDSPSRQDDYPRGRVYCECENCTHRWTEDEDRIGTIRCPVEDCGSKNINLDWPDDV